jgi:steroid delta-isomerase-like uncharacterized protein
MAAENEQLVRRWFEEVWNKGRLEAIDELLAKDVIAHGLGPGGSDLQGREGFKTFYTRFKGAFPDIQITVEDVIAEGDRAAARYSGRATHSGDHLGIAATQRPVTFTGMSFVRCRRGQIAEGWNNFDLLGMLHQVGAIQSAVDLG